MDEQILDDGLKWFGEGFDGFPKRLPDDCVEYVIYLVNGKLNSLAAVRGRLNEILKAAKELTKSLLKDYIWQRDGFELTLQPKFDPANKSPAPPHLRGRTDFGDSVADEWLIVYVLRELSTTFPDAWIRVYDTDGEFLLIESANSLPKWLNPETAENRVWINNSHLKIMPLKDETSRNISVQEALTAIKTTPENLLCDPAVEKEAFHRLREYPSAISSSLHHAFTTIPRRLAHILHRNPAYISPAVEAFYLRDPISLKPLSTKDLATLNFPPEDFVTVSVKFTRVGYAQLRSQLFDPPPAWTGVVPKMKDEKVAMGMKLTCGFDILLSDAQSQPKRVVREIKLLLEDLESGDEALPTDSEIDSWSKTQDNERWLDIDYNDFDTELSGNGKPREAGAGNGFGDQGAQENLRKMVSRFQDFLNDEGAGAEGVDDLDDDDDDDNGTESGDENEAVNHGGTSESDEADFERAMKQTREMSQSHIEQIGLLEEARKLALQDDEDASDVDEDEEMRKVMELIEKELKGHGALDANGKSKSKGNGKAFASTSKPVFGPERPPHLQENALAKNKVWSEDGTESADEEIGPGDEELSSDDEEFNDVDLGLAKNMLESFKGQAGMTGPAGNLMKALGVGMPRDEDRE